MKKICLSAFLLIFSTSIHASGQFDGIYMISVNGSVVNYVTIHEDANTNQMIAVVVDPDPDNAWAALSGIRSGNAVTLVSIGGVSPSDITLTVHADFNNNLNPSATIIACVDGIFYACKFPAGASLNMTKVF